MSIYKSIDAELKQNHRISFAELYNEISADLDAKIAKFQARAALVCANDE